MKLPIIRQLYRSTDKQKLENTLEVLEEFSALRGVSEDELNVTGELITNICGALDVHHHVENGKTETEALNAFAQKVLGSIDR